MRKRTLEQKTAQDFAALQIDQLQKLTKGSMSYEQIKWFNNIPYEHREALMKPTKSCRLISGKKVLKLDAVDGQQTIANTIGGVKSDNRFRLANNSFEELKINNKSDATPETVISVYELVEEAIFPKIFTDISSDLGKLCLTQHQILNFVHKYPGWVRRDSGETLFLIKMKKEFDSEELFVVRLDLFNSGLMLARTAPFGNTDTRNAFTRHRIVVPRLTF